jgi:TolB-like protein/DNA-binding winged helix-turn-helix (wHTH) protein/Flp pilus assembly protein TadD
VLDPESGDLERGGARIRLQEQPARVLQELIAHAGNVVTREQLIALLWPKGVVDFDTGLNTVIRKLRVALEDTADTPRYIETLPRRGYRFVGTLDVQPEASPRAPPAAAIAPVPQRSSLAVPEAPVPVDVRPAIHPAEAETPDLPAQHPQYGPVPWRILLAFLAVIGGLTLLIVQYRSHGFDVTGHQSVAVTSRSTALVNAPGAFAPPAHSIAVLPFVNLSSDKEQEYFADGLAEELLDLLAKTPGLHVIARTSSFSFKGRSDDIPTIASKLNVANILEGGVRKSGNRLRVTAQLIRTDTSEHLWSETYERDIDDVFKVQDEIASAVAAALKLHLLPVQSQSHRSELRTSNLEAYDLYLQGRESYNQGNAAGYQRAVYALTSATALDPQYAAAYAALGLAKFWAEDSNPRATHAAYDRALAATERAVALAPEEAVGYSARGFLRTVYRFDFAGAQSDLAKAVALNPGDANVLHRSAVLLATLGYLSAAIDREEKALTLDPLSAEICMRLAFFYMAAGRFEDARPLYEKALAIAPNSVRARVNLGDLELLENRLEPASASYRQNESESFMLSGQARAEYSLGHAEASQRLLQELIAKYPNDPYGIARVCAWRGETDRAFEWLERAFVMREPALNWLKIDPFFRELHKDARYTALLHTMNLPE